MSIKSIDKLDSLRSFPGPDHRLKPRQVVLQLFVLLLSCFTSVEVEFLAPNQSALYYKDPTIVP